jgi:hypothetical protein
LYLRNIGVCGKMYTRFKSQKSGIKLGINTLTNPTRSRVLIPTNGTSTGTSSCSSTSSSSQNVNLLSVLDSSENPITSTAKVIIADQPSVVADENVLISGDISTISYQMNKDAETKQNTKTKTNKKVSSSTSKDNGEEQVDPSCLSYVKSSKLATFYFVLKLLRSN